jgi:hypothetical protein
VTVNLEQVPLVVYLKARDALYYGKVWSSARPWKIGYPYIPQTFPHYTRHTVLHSDNIIVQVSKLLFEDDDPQQRVVQLFRSRSLRLYGCSVPSRAGMVVPDREKAEILSPMRGEDWTSEREGAPRGGAKYKRFAKVESLLMRLYETS